jgi:hypothetical protein
LVAAVVLLVGVANLAVADFVVHEVETRFNGDALYINSAPDMTLSARTEEALNKGVTFDVLVDIALVEIHPYWWNRVVTDQTLKRHVQYHALSGQYLVSDGDAPDYQRFATAQAALAYAGALNGLEIPLPKKKDISDKRKYTLRLRVYLDIESLPTLLRPLAYASPSWHHNSGWTTWAVQR